MEEIGYYRANAMRCRRKFHCLWAIVCLLPLACLIDSDASLITVDATAGPGLRSLADTSGAALASGNQVQLGYFDSGFNFTTMSGDLAEARTAWNPFGSLAVTSIATESGRFSGSITDDDSGFVGEQIYLFAFQTSGSTAPDPSWSNVEAYGIFTNNASSDWIFPDGNTLGNETFVSTDAVTVAHWGNIESSSLGLSSPVPEASPAWLSGLILGVSAVMSRRRSARNRTAKT
ncbi:MAG: hypothetical protein ACI9UA_000168 [Pseudoalteromonas tetraodonis]|jgi:hypothetical protein